MPPASIEGGGRMVALTKCVVCRATFDNVHLLEWAPVNPPLADGYQRSACVACFARITGRRATLPPALASAVEEVANNA